MNSVRHILAQTILSDGSLLHDEPQLVMDWPEDEQGIYGDPYHIRRDPQGGYVITTRKFWQRLDNNLEPQWDHWGVLVYSTWDPPFYNLDQVSTPVILSDRSVLQLCTNPEFNLSFLEQINFDGTRPLGTNWGPVAGDSTYRPAYPGPDFPSLDGNSAIVTYQSRLNNEPAGPVYRMLQRVSPDGENLWSDILIIGDDENFDDAIRPWCVLPVNEYNICYLIMRDSHGDRSFSAFKVNTEDGTIAGDTSVEEHSPPINTIPVTSRIVSAYPNPFNDTVHVNVEITQHKPYNLTVYNILGHEVSNHELNPNNAVSAVVPVTFGDHLSSGVYFIALHGPEGLCNIVKVGLVK